jgi:hypothetical protein
VTADPFTALGLPVRPDLTDDDVRSAWRRIAAATHPDRADGGDPDRFAVAAAAYTDLRTRDGRGEAYADLAAGRRRRRGPAGRVPPPHPRAAPAGTRGGSVPGSTPAPGTTPAPHTTPRPEATAPGATPPRAAATPVSPRGRRGHGGPAAAALAARIRRGRPVLLALRVAITAGVCAAAFGIVGVQPAAAGLAAGALTWLLLTARHDLMPPGNE